MSNIPQLDIAPPSYRCSQRLPASCRYRVDHVFTPVSNQKEVQDFLTNCADRLENSKLETAHHPTMHLINKRRVLKPRYNNGRYATQTQRNDASARQIQMQIQRQYHQTAKKPLPPVYDEENQVYEPQNYGVTVNIFQSEYNQDNLISVPQSIRIRMYHRNEMIQSQTNDEEVNDTQVNNEVDDDLPIPPYEEDNENLGEEIDEKDIDKAADSIEATNNTEASNNTEVANNPEAADNTEAANDTQNAENDSPPTEDSNNENPQIEIESNEDENQNNDNEDTNENTGDPDDNGSTQ